ncbi:hypothetical protein E2986_06968 [Frieseomelitta varia]|uniref:t-SNARE coiled-coil homology domain-containing protein n=1 Tax=Frieseomelitta varia TaxID=561572 RepID=A0A833RBG7_9HYME|nr:hypothetical protein E2986_06968 [Frieseomelitta varia]
MHNNNNGTPFVRKISSRRRTRAPFVDLLSIYLDVEQLNSSNTKVSSQSPQKWHSFTSRTTIPEYEACEKLFREIMEQFTARNKHSKTLQAYASISANIRIHLKQYSREVQQLKNKVDDALKSKAMYPFARSLCKEPFNVKICRTVEEAERRIRQIEILESKDVQLQKLYDARTNSYASSRASLLTTGTSAFADGGTTSWAADDDDDKPVDTQVTVTDLVTHQDKILQEQNKGLEELGKVIAKQKQIGQTISDEVDHQNDVRFINNQQSS